MKNFSFIINSRGRPKMLENLLDSITRTTDNLHKIDAYIGLDNDDVESLEFAKRYRKQFDIYFITGDRPESLNANFNKLAFMADGQYQCNSNDDVEFDNSCLHWDTIILDKIRQFKQENNIKDDIIYVGCADSSIDKPEGSKYASFPIVSKQAVEVLGYHMDADFVGLGADNALHRVYEAVNRTLYIPEIKFRHYLHETLFSIMTPDQTAAEMRAKSWEKGLTPDNYDINPSVEKLKNFIENYK